MNAAIAYSAFCTLRDARKHGAEAPMHTEAEAFALAVQSVQPLVYPATLTTDLEEVLGMPNFRCAPTRTCVPRCRLGGAAPKGGSRAGLYHRQARAPRDSLRCGLAQDRRGGAGRCLGDPEGKAKHSSCCRSA
jgi:hypothetical protein